jgi:hypothetical protein
VPKCVLPKSIPLHVQEVGIYEPKDHVGEKALSLELSAKVWAHNNNRNYRFFPIAC